ncbi:MAG: ferritin-like domain-containing protein [Chloroflexi bacterium]|nr:ferritin-like domain-containing protein [Chloroflexota bacterium]
MANKELIITWLNNAHSMEEGIAQVLERHAEDAKDQPQMQARLQQHVEQTRHHAELVKGCLERLGESPSGVKSGMASVMGAVQGMSTKMAEDTPVKNTLHDYGTEHFEIACYTSLMAAAQDLGDQQTMTVCQQILREEEAMAEFLFQQIPPVTVQMLQKEHAMASQ